MTIAEKIMLDTFMDCLCDDNYTALGDTDEERAANWKALQEEYMQLIQDTASDQIQAYEDELFFWETQMVIIESAVNLLRVWRDENAINMLREKGYHYAFSDTDVEAYNKDLDRVLKRLAAVRTQQANRKHELSQITDSMPSKKPTRSDFMANIVAFSSSLGYNIEETKTSVAKYVAIRNFYHLKLEQLNNTGNGK